MLLGRLPVGKAATQKLACREGWRGRSMADRYNIVSEDDLRMAVQKTTRYVDTLPTKQLVVSASSSSLLVRLLRPNLHAQSWD